MLDLAQLAHQVLSDAVGVKTPRKKQQAAKQQTAPQLTKVPGLTCRRHRTSQHEERAMAEWLRQQMADGTPSGEIVVLCPTNNDVARISKAFAASGLPLDPAATAAATTAGGATHASYHLFDQPGVDAAFALLQALASPSDSLHLYNLLRSDLFAVPRELLLQLMERHAKRHVPLLQALHEYVAEEACSSSSSDPIVRFLALFRRLQDDAHAKSTQELVQLLLDATGRLPLLLDPSSPAQEAESLAFADFLREIAAAQHVVKSAHVARVAPYLLHLRGARLAPTPPPATTNSDQDDSKRRGIRVLPLTHQAIHTLEVRPQASLYAVVEYDDLMILDWC